MSDKENDNSSDFSFKLTNVYKQKSKKKKISKKTFSFNDIILDEIDLTNESKTELKDFKLKKKYFSNIKEGILSNCNIKSSYNENVNKDQNDNSPAKVTQNLNSEVHLYNTNKKMSKLEYDDLNADNLVEDKKSSIQNNYSTPKTNHIQNYDTLESAKLLDRIYGNEWRHIDGVIRNSKKKRTLHQPINNFNM